MSDLSLTSLSIQSSDKCTYCGLGAEYQSSKHNTLCLFGPNKLDKFDNARYKWLHSSMKMRLEWIYIEKKYKLMLKKSSSRHGVGFKK
jgi:hypothetical protein